MRINRKLLRETILFSPQDKETSMELKMRLNLLAALASFGFVAAIAFGMF